MGEEPELDEFRQAACIPLEVGQRAGQVEDGTVWFDHLHARGDVLQQAA
ncbi:hypothetical protein [Streptomyces sp. NPDC001642]